MRIETAEVVEVTPGAPVQLALGDGRYLSADAVVLASGRPQSGMPDSLERAFAPVLAEGADSRIVLDPWAPGALEALGARRPASVLVIGSGLTGVDVALHLTARGATVTLLSRHGALPRRFRATGPPTELPNLDALAAEVSLEQLRAALAADLAHAAEGGVDWRQVIDAVRPRTARLWQSLGWEDQRRFLREDLRQWEVLRHRMPPTIADAIYAAIDSGQLVIEAGEVADVSLRRKGVELVVTTSDRSVRRRGDAVVVAAGSAWDRRSLQRSALWANLLAADVASLHPSGVGVRLTPEGFLIDGAGSAVPGIVCIGSIRQGEEWETTAIPEIRSPGRGDRDAARRRHPRPTDAGAQPHHDCARIDRCASVIRRRCASAARRSGRRLDRFRRRGRRGSTPCPRARRVGDDRDGTTRPGRRPRRRDRSSRSRAGSARTRQR